TYVASLNGPSTMAVDPPAWASAGSEVTSARARASPWIVYRMAFLLRVPGERRGRRPPFTRPDAGGGRGVNRLPGERLLRRPGTPLRGRTHADRAPPGIERGRLERQHARERHVRGHLDQLGEANRDARPPFGVHARQQVPERDGVARLGRGEHALERRGLIR